MCAVHSPFALTVGRRQGAAPRQEPSEGPRRTAADKNLGTLYVCVNNRKNTQNVRRTF